MLAIFLFLVQMIDKYGDEVLRELEEEKQNKEEKEAAVSGNTKCKSDCLFLYSASNKFQKLM